ncbi:MAG: DEAD/DEAH box helicase [Candidatus Hermodarchaeota archaeon]
MVTSIIHALKGDPRYRPYIEHIATLPVQEAIYGKLKIDLPDKIQSYLTKKNIQLYKHQCDAIEKLRLGKNIIITTPTASGKSLAFNLPIFEQLHYDEEATALYLYPTKALSNDQLKTIKEYEQITKESLRANVYDGDTPASKRPNIRETSRIVISNLHMLHQVLSWHHKWQIFFKNLRYVVIDEAHRYRGVFGSNIAFLIRRLRRICELYGTSPQFILSTATLANPLEFGEKLTGLNFELIAQDCSPNGKKYFVLYNPFVDKITEGGTLSTHQETKELFLFYVKNNLQTLCFTISRKMAELITLWSKTDLKKSKPELLDKITAYRAGYLPEERRIIENDLKSGLLRGVTSTNALELGIDIGSLDSVIISGYPGTMISTWQQAGRAGRGIQDSIVTLIAFHNPLDQYFMKHPNAFFDKSHEHAIIDLSNPYILSGQLICATAERPLQLEEEETYFGDDPELILKELEKQKLVRNTPYGWVYSGKERATDAVSLNRISSETFKVVCNDKLLETMSRTQAYRDAHKGAILLHQGEPYIVQDLDLKTGLVQVEKKDVDYYTESLKITEIRILQELKTKEVADYSVSFGKVEVDEWYTSYKIMGYDKVEGIEPLDLPELKFESEALWFRISEDIWQRIKIKKLDFEGGLHGTEHAIIGIMPYHVMCDRWDIGGVSTPYHPDTQYPTIFIYDGFEGGIGLTEKAFELFVEVVKMAYELVRDCKCEDGCPACTYSPKCGSGNKPLDKKATVLILGDILAKTQTSALI